MSEMYNKKRVFFPKGKQEKFLIQCKSRTNWTWANMSKELGVNPRTLADWRREKFSMSLDALKLLSTKTSIPFPNNIQVKEPFWYVSKGGYAGGKAVMKLYGKVPVDEKHRKKKWQDWWEKEGKEKFTKNNLISINTPLSITEPPKTIELAEFIGILLGDGHISHYQVTITLHSEDDKEYKNFVVKMIQRLFETKPSVYRHKKHHVNTITISRKSLIELLTQKLGLKIGNKVKQQVDVPQWIKNNRRFRVACVRGLVDTDGSVFTHKYKVKKKLYAYKKLSFCSQSLPLIDFVAQTLSSMGLKPRLVSSISKNEVRLDSIKDMKKYFKLISSHNSKHLKKYTN